MDEKTPGAARAAIADCVHRYALAIRRGDPASCALLFTADGVFEVREGDPRRPGSAGQRSLVEGRAAIAKYVGAAGGQHRMLPMIHNLLIEVSGDAATASSLMVGRVWPSDQEVIGEYADSFRREDGKWHFSRRIYTIFRAVEAD